MHGEVLITNCLLIYLTGLPIYTEAVVAHESLMMDAPRKKALRQFHPDLRTSVRVANFLPNLGFLNDEEDDRIRKNRGYVKQVDELITILQTKTSKDFDFFCDVLKENGYIVWSDRLREAAGLGKR